MSYRLYDDSITMACEEGIEFERLATLTSNDFCRKTLNDMAAASIRMGQQLLSLQRKDQRDRTAP